MELFEFFQTWLQAHPVTTSVIKYLVWVLLVVVVISLFRRLLRRRLPDSSTRYNVQKGIEIIGYILIVLLTVSYFTGNIRDVTLIIGLLTAGITITLQELVLSVAGSFFIFLVKVYQPGTSSTSASVRKSKKRQEKCSWPPPRSKSCAFLW
jgi:membrane protein implicated in regulation of membrane protease activity